jgi:hypothetical protein
MKVIPYKSLQLCFILAASHCQICLLVSRRFTLFKRFSTGKFNPDTDNQDLSGKAIAIAGGMSKYDRSSTSSVQIQSSKWWSAKSNNYQASISGGPGVSETISNPSKKFPQLPSRLNILLSIAGIMTVLRDDRR